MIGKSECDSAIERKIIDDINKRYGFLKNVSKWEPKTVTENRNFKAHYEPGENDLEGMVRDELKRRIGLGNKGQSTSHSQTQASFTGLIPFSPADCKHNINLINQGCILPSFNILLGGFVENLPEDSKPEKLDEISERLYARNHFLETIFGLSKEQLDDYKPNIKEVGFRFTLEGMGFVKELIKNLAATLNFSFRAYRNLDYPSSICIEQLMGLIEIDNQNSNKVNLKVERRGSYQFNHGKHEKIISKLRNTKTRNEESLNVLKNSMVSLDRSWINIGNTPRILSGSPEEVLSSMSKYIIPHVAMIELFSKLARLNYHVFFESNSGAKGISLEFSNNKLSVITNHTVSDNDKDIIPIQKLYHPILPNLKDIHWSIAHPSEGNINRKEHIVKMHTLLANGKYRS